MDAPWVGSAPSNTSSCVHRITREHKRLVKQNHLRPYRTRGTTQYPNNLKVCQSYFVHLLEKERSWMLPVHKLTENLMDSAHLLKSLLQMFKETYLLQFLRIFLAVDYEQRMPQPTSNTADSNCTRRGANLGSRLSIQKILDVILIIKTQSAQLR